MRSVFQGILDEEQAAAKEASIAQAEVDMVEEGDAHEVLDDVDHEAWHTVEPCSTRVDTGKALLPTSHCVLADFLVWSPHFLLSLFL